MKLSLERTVQWNWRTYFQPSVILSAEKDVRTGKILNFTLSEDGRTAEARSERGFNMIVRDIPTTIEQYRDYPEWTVLELGKYKKGKNHFSNYYFCSCSQGEQGMRCRHLAGLLLSWEAQRGPFVIPETEQERERRIREVKLEAKKKEKQSRVSNAALGFRATQKNESGLYFPPQTILEGADLLTDEYEIDLAQELARAGADVGMTVELAYSDRGEQCLMARASVESNSVEIMLTHSVIGRLSCTCGRAAMPRWSFWSSKPERPGRMCAHALAAWAKLQALIYRENPGDETDYVGSAFLNMMINGAFSEKKPEAEGEFSRKRAVVALIPRLVWDRSRNEMKLAFDIGRVGERAYAVKGLESLVSAVEDEDLYKLGKNAEINFSQETFSEDSAGWYQMAESRVREIRRINHRLEANFGISYYSRISAGNGVPLMESELDAVYDRTQGGEILYQYGARAESCKVPVRRVHPKAQVTVDPIMKDKRLRGLRFEGNMPALLRGIDHRYVLDQTCFGRVDDGEMRDLEPLQAISDSKGHFECVIGEKKYAEFYYRVLPQLQRSEQIALTDNAADLMSDLLPPEPEFAFYIDLGDRITCDTRVMYGDRTLSLGLEPETPLGHPRDWEQEKRVAALVQGFFPERDRETGTHFAVNDDESLVRVLTEGVPALSEFGQVHGSEAFRKVRVRPIPQSRISLRVEGGLLDLSVQTKDLSDEELLALLQSYRLKRRWHRLRGGDFIDLSNPRQLEELDETVQAMDLSLEALVSGTVQLPMYRAIYVDRLLEAHNALAASRDRQFKALVRSFQTIKDSDFDVPEGLVDVLRSYQVYGFRWLSTLSQAGFGGILADEMGLGKTVQMLAFLESRRLSGEARPALVVCPASLVYNWREECRRFTPELTVETLAGNLPQRKKQLKQLAAGEAANLYITSYDLLKRDIALYDDITFSTVALDEAQYIKNHKAAVSKAVRVLKAEHRFALTGTPIENRLSELWSIFDFLMPGFLYSAQEFEKRFEIPIMKRKDAAMTERLSKMTGPFILRRKKQDVLKDLPDKIEETRATPMDEDQRRLYDAQVVRMQALLAASGDTGEDKLRVLAEITRLRQLCCDPSLLFEDYKGSSAKRAACLELIQNAMDAGHRMLVFSQFTSMLKLLAEDLEGAGIRYYTITGSTPKQERVRLVNAFNGGDVPVFLISLKAGGTGLNLTGADVVIHYDPWWNLAIQSQATDRAHRIGQTREVTVIKLIAAESIEEKIVQLQEAKRDLAEAIINGQNTSLMSLSREELMELLA